MARLLETRPKLNARRKNGSRRMCLQLVECRIRSASGNTANTSTLDWARDEKMSCGPGAGDSVYHVVLDPSNYSKFIRLLFCEPPEPDALNGTVNRVVKPMGHFKTILQFYRWAYPDEISNFVTMYRVERPLELES